MRTTHFMQDFTSRFDNLTLRDFICSQKKIERKAQFENTLHLREEQYFLNRPGACREEWHSSHYSKGPQIEVLTHRFVYHTSCPSNRNSIVREGLRADYSPHLAVYANNLHDVNSGLYPSCHYDSMDGLDLWRIDTKGLSVKWFEDFKLGLGNSYIYSFENIYPRRLKLYTIVNMSNNYLTQNYVAIPKKLINMRLFKFYH